MEETKQAVRREALADYRAWDRVLEHYTIGTTSTELTDLEVTDFSSSIGHHSQTWGLSSAHVISN